MTDNETLVVKAVFALAAKVVNISPEEMDRYLNIGSQKKEPVQTQMEKPKQHRQCQGDEHLMRRAIELLQMYHMRHTENLSSVEQAQAAQRLLTAVKLMEDCAKAFAMRRQSLTPVVSEPR